MVITRVKYKINEKSGEIKIMRKIRVKYKNNNEIKIIAILELIITKELRESDNK